MTRAIAPLLALVVVFGCGADSDDAQKRSTSRTAEARPFPVKPGPLRAGVYRTTRFEPGFSLKIPKGWIPIARDRPRLFSLAPRYNPTGGPSPTLLAFLRIVRVVDPDADVAGRENVDDALRPPPDDLARFFAGNPRLDTSRPRPVTLDGVEGMQIDVRLGAPYRSPLCGPAPCVLTHVTEPELPAKSLFSVGPDATYRGIFLPDVAPNFAIAIIGPTKGFEKRVAELERALETIEFRE